MVKSATQSSFVPYIETKKIFLYQSTQTTCSIVVLFTSFMHPDWPTQPNG